MLPRLSIRNTFLIVISILNLLIATMVGYGVYKSWLHLRDARQLQQASSDVNLLYSANKDLSQERGDALPILYADPQTAAALQESLLRNRAAADGSLDRALDRLQQHATRPVSLAQVQEKRKTLQELRGKMTAALMEPQKRRDLNLPDVYFAASSGLIQSVHNLILSYTRPLLAIDSTVAQQMMFKHFVWELADYAGREYALIGRLIVENKAPTRQQLEQLASWRSRIQYGWEIIRKFSINDDLARKLAPYMEEAESHYFLTFEQIKDLFYAPAGVSPENPYPISIEFWLEMASQAVDSLLALQNEALQETQNHVNAMAVQAQREIALSIAIFLCALLLTLYCWSIIILRIVNPVNKMVDALYKATQNSGQEAYLNGEQDEISKLARVLEVFQENARTIQQSNEELERYAYIASHDLKSPLRAIDNLSSWVAEELGPALDGKSKEYMEMLRQRVRRMEKLLDDTLEYSRLGKKFEVSENDVIDGRHLVEDTVALVAPPRDFRVVIGPDLAKVRLQRMPLQQVLYNLINNAVKHHDRENGCVSIDIEDKDSMYVFTVRDDGPGIASEYHQKIFEMFQTLQPRDKREGSGMGLAFVKKILSQCGGSITLDSAPGKGSCFRFTWPKTPVNKSMRRIMAG